MPKTTRSVRQSSVEDGAAAPTRTSRRLRGTSDDSASPLRSLSPPKRKRNASSKAPKVPSKLYITRQNTSKQSQQQADATTAPLGMPSPDEHLTLETLHKYHSAFEIAIDESVRESIIKALEVLANQNPTLVARMLLEQRSQIINQTRRADANERVAEIESQRATDATEKLKVAQTELGQVSDWVFGSPPPASEKSSSTLDSLFKSPPPASEKSPRKRPAPTEEGDENEERPSRRQRRTSQERPSPRQRLSTEAATQSPRESLQESAQEAAHESAQEAAEESDDASSEESAEVSPQVSPQMPNGRATTLTSHSDIAAQFPATAALAALNEKSSHRYSDDSSDDEEDTPTRSESGFKRYMRERNRQKELERQKEEWLGAAFTRPDLPFPIEAIRALNENNEQQSTNDDGNQTSTDDVIAAAAVSDETESTAPVYHNYASTALSPISEATEPETPAPRRWGFSSLVAPVSRLFGLTPRTEPARRAARPEDKGTTAPATTPVRPSANTAVQRQPATEQPTRNKNSRLDGADDEEPSTPTNNIAITKDTFMPQSAPQERAPLTGRRAKSVQQRLREQGEAASRRAAAAEAKRQAEREAEDRRLAEDIAAKRAESIKYIAEKHAQQEAVKAVEATQKSGSKRKVRIDDLKVIPRPARGGVGIDEQYLNVDDSLVEVDDDVSMLDVATPPPAKRVRFGDDTSESTINTPSPGQASQKKNWLQKENDFNVVSPHKAVPSPSTSDDPHHARPYTGKMFAAPVKENSFSGANIFEEQTQKSPAKQALAIDLLSAIAYGQQHGVWIGAKRTEPVPKGSYAVPDDTDSEEEVDDDNTSPTPVQKKTGECVARGNIFMTQSEVENSAAEKEAWNQFEKAREFEDQDQDEQVFTQQPPPTPTPAHAALPSTPGANGAEAAVAKARAEATKYKPKTPSGLRAASRLSSSPATAGTNGVKTPIQSEATPFAHSLEVPAEYARANDIPEKAFGVPGPAVNTSGSTHPPASQSSRSNFGQATTISSPSRFATTAAKAPSDIAGGEATGTSPGATARTTATPFGASETSTRTSFGAPSFGAPAFGASSFGVSRTNTATPVGASQTTIGTSFGAPSFGAPSFGAPAFGASPFGASRTTTGSSFGAPAFGASTFGAPQAIAENPLSVPRTATGFYKTGESKSIPYKKTNQYAIDLANAIPADQLGPGDFNFPKVPRRPKSPGHAAAIATAEADPNWEKSIEELRLRVFGSLPGSRTIKPLTN